MAGLRSVSVALIAGVVTMAVVSGQGAPAPQAPADSMSALLSEVRELRAELKQATRTSIQMQLLVARLGLQEGRISTLSGQLASVRQQLANAQMALIPMQGQQLANAQMALIPMQGQLKQFQEAGGETVNEVTGLKPILDAMQKQERALRDQESQLDGLLNIEQGRWQDFNQRIDALESTLPSTVR